MNSSWESTASTGDSRRSQRISLGDPQSIAAFVSSMLEPFIIVATYLLVCRWFDEPIVRSDLTLCFLVLALTFPGKNRFGDRPLNAAVDITSSWIALLLILALGAYATNSFLLFDKQVLAIWASLTPVILIGTVLSGRRALKHHIANPSNHRSAVVIGAGTLGVKVAGMLIRADGVDFVGHFDDRADERIAKAGTGPLLGSLASASGFIRSRGVHDVYITLPLGSQPRIVKLLESIQETTASVYFAPDIFGISIIQGRLTNFGGVPIVALCDSPFKGLNALIKRTSDIVLSFVILALTAPLMLSIAAGVRLSSPGSAIFRQRRNGLNGEEIVVYKFRSMTTSDDGQAVPQATKNDLRITPFGAFLRRTSLDELPQFINVLQGRMSIVGPRPHAVAHNEQYRQLLKAYMVRHKVKPGITGWAQVNGLRGETETLDKMHARLEFDLEYLRNWSLGLDLRIIARTVKVIFFDKNAY